MRTSLFISLITALNLTSAVARAEDDSEGFEPFDVQVLPPGKELTLPHPAYMMAPLTMQLQVQANDRAQVLKLSTLAKSGNTKPLPIAIYDRQSMRVRRFTLQSGISVIYHFRSLNPIRIVPDLAAVPQADRSEQKILLESNRPLGISYSGAAQTMY